MSDMAVILGLPRTVVESLGLFDEQMWRNDNQNYGRSTLLLQFCLNAISYVQGTCVGCGVCLRKMTAKERGRIDYHHLVQESKYDKLSNFICYPSFHIGAELRKCVAICRNCHSYETAGQNEAKRARLS